MLHVQNLTDSMQGSLWDMITGAGIMVKLVLILLLTFSILSWAIIIYKYRIMRKMERGSAEFLELFWQKKQMASIYEASLNYKSAPLARLFAAAYKDLMRTMAQKREAQDKASQGLSPEFQLGELATVQRVLKKTISNEISGMEKAVSFLATTGNTAPFIGLFGTVWGIMDSFRGIGLRGSASLAVVAPGISEALIATAIGLIAAIPAVLAYNHFVTRINRMTVEMENFAGDFLNIVERELAKERK